MAHQPSQKRALALLLVVGTAIVLIRPPDFQADKAVGETTAEVPPITNQSALVLKLSPLVDKTDRIGVAAKDLKTGETFTFGESETFDAASTMKLLIVGYMYHEASNNQFDLDEVQTLTAGEIQRYGTGSIQYQPAPWQFSYRDLARLMMNESDNTAAVALSNRLDMDEIQTFGDSLGLADTKVKENTTTPADMTKLLELLYRNEVADGALTQDLFASMRDTEFEDRLPARLPKDAVVTHKTGDAFDGGFHDVGIIDYHGRTYAVSLFGNGLSKAQLADVSRDIFAYFTRPQN